MDVVETCGEGSLSSAQRGFPSIDDDEIVGFEKDAEIIMKKLIRGTKERDVISIYGMPGLGKTTLARKVYNNPSIVDYFDVKAWCAVSQAYNRRMLLVEIFKQATNDEIKIKEADDVADMLRRVLIGKRYLIVLDDIWDVEAWEDLGICFPEGEYGSRVMVTTRIEQVAKHLQYHSEPYSLKFLTEEQSWELLQKKVFRGENCPSDDLLKAGLQVAQHCKGLPLVVVLIAGIIAKLEREASLWLEVANDLSSLALGEQSMKVIQSSYDHLEDHLKPCLLYMGLFPEDHEIPVYDLLKLWMAEEFVLNVDEENMEEASRACLSDLLNRSLVMVSRMRINGDMVCCVLHDVVREFCLRKLEEEKFMQLTVPYSPYQHCFDFTEWRSRSTIYIHDELVKQLDDSKYQLRKIPMLKSKSTYSLEFIAHPKLNTWNNRSNPLYLVVELRYVRALHLMDVELLHSRDFEILRWLTELRYLALAVIHFEFRWILHLRYLQTLQVKSHKMLCLRGAKLWEMTKLRHVNIEHISLEGEYNDQESSTSMLENMKTFCTFYINRDDMNPRLWWRFPNLEELSLCMQYAPEFPLFPISEVHSRLHSLSLKFTLREFWDSVGWESYFVFPSNLRHLSLKGFVLTEKMVSNIARLRKLESLTLQKGLPSKGLEKYSWDVTNVEFPSLKYLILFYMEMDEWIASEDSFPVLEKLVIQGGYHLKEIPPSFVDIPTLRLIELYKCIDSLEVSARNIKRDIEENTGCDTLQVVIL